MVKTDVHALNALEIQLPGEEIIKDGIHVGRHTIATTRLARAPGREQWSKRVTRRAREERGVGSRQGTRGRRGAARVKIVTVGTTGSNLRERRRSHFIKGR